MRTPHHQPARSTDQLVIPIRCERDGRLTEWLKGDEPDPNKVHYTAIVEAAHAICRHHKIKSEDLQLWIE